MQTWNVPVAPNGHVLGYDLARVQETNLFRSDENQHGHHFALYALDSEGEFYAEKEPLILVHGLEGGPQDLQAVVNRLRGSAEYQLYVAAYPDFHRRTSLNGKDFADELRRLSATLGEGRDLTIVAHSMGGIVTRQAMNDLVTEGHVGSFGRLRVFAIDSPWHGYPGPEDGFAMDFVRPFLPAGLEDMRARSPMFEHLYAVELPDSVQMKLAFAETRTVVLDYTESPLTELAGKLADYYKFDTKVVGEPMVMNFWRALLSSDAYSGFQEEVRAQADTGALDESTVQEALLQWFPRFPGDHVGVLQEHHGQLSFIDFLQRHLLPGVAE